MHYVDLWDFVDIPKGGELLAWNNPVTGLIVMTDHFNGACDQCGICYRFLRISVDVEICAQDFNCLCCGDDPEWYGIWLFVYLKISFAFQLNNAFCFCKSGWVFERTVCVQ